MKISRFNRFNRQRLRLPCALPVTAAILTAGSSLLAPRKASAAGAIPTVRTNCIQFVVMNPVTGRPIPSAYVVAQRSGENGKLVVLNTSQQSLNPATMMAVTSDAAVETIALAPGQALRVALPSPPGRSHSVPTSDIYIVVRAALLLRNETAPGVVTTHQQITQSAAATVGGSVLEITKSEAGVATDSSGQEHVRGEHAEIAYVVDGVPLPDTLSGRQGSIVVLSTIQDLQFLTGSFPAEYGGQTAAVLNINTLPPAQHAHQDVALQAGSYDTTNGDLTLQGPLGRKAGYVLDFGGTRTLNANDPQQPNNLTAHNTGAGINEFAKLRFRPTTANTFTITLSSSPNSMQLNNRTGLPSSYADVGQGFGFLGLRNANGVLPTLAAIHPGGLGSGVIPLPSQQSAGMAISQSEQNEFGVLEWQHRFNQQDHSVLAVTFLHSGQNLYNSNPAVNQSALPIDNSIEFNPTVARNVHHVQFVGSVTLPRKSHRFKAGFLLDSQSGNESYNIIPASQLALDALAAAAPALAPAGSAQMTPGAGGTSTPALDVNGNPVYNATGPAPVVNVHRSGFYRAAYLQDTWKESRRFTINYGLRYDWFKQGQNLGQPVVDTSFLSPRFNFAYSPDRLTSVRWSYDRLFNFPPIAQGSVVGQPIKPETLDQIDFSVQREIARNQSLKLAYYIKDIKNQVDTGLLIPGSAIGLYQSVNFQHGGVHGFELSYDVSPTGGHGFGSYVNWSYSLAAPAGLDNAGQPSPQFNDHDQRNTVDTGLSYTWKSNADASIVFSYGSGLTNSIVPPSLLRTPNTDVDLHLATSPKFLWGHGSLALDIHNLMDSRTVINFQSGFSGTRFQNGRTILVSATSHF